ncbi:MAG: ribonuclease H-like domain-containing protein [Anaerolineales bacterium]
MTSLSKNLKALGVRLGADSIKSPSKSDTTPQLTDLFAGSWEKTSSGDCFVIRKSFPRDTLHGNLSFLREPDLQVFDYNSSLSGISSIPLNNFLFIDTETTGLSGGAGTYVFLIGAAKFVDNALSFAQFFLQDPANEPAQLEALEKFIAPAKVIISYNGKSFDLPRLITRYKFHGWPSPFENIYHLDLLHIARRLWKLHLPSCSLGDIEHYLLGITRSSIDIPGWQVAAHFFDYLQTSDPSPLSSVFYHNEIDVISLVTLLNYIDQRLSDPLADDYQSQEDLVSIGTYLFHQKQTDQAISVLSHALNNVKLLDGIYQVGLSNLASFYKKMCDYSNALPLWEKSAALGNLRSFIELAIYFEHKKNDYQEALHWTLSGLEALSDQSQENQNTTTKIALEHRLSRLKMKIAASNQ